MGPPARPERRIPSGGRPAPNRLNTPSSVPVVDSSDQNLRTFDTGASTASLDRLLTELEHEITASPQMSPSLEPAAEFDPQVEKVIGKPPGGETAPLAQRSGRSATINLDTQPVSPQKHRAHTLFSNSISPRKPKPKMSLITTNLKPPDSDKRSPVSPGAKHWTHVRAQVLGDHGQTPIDRPAPAKKQGLVSKAAGRLGFRQAAENVMGYGPELSDLLGRSTVPMTAQEEEEARERRGFSRAVKTCSESCAQEETRRRLDGLKSRDRLPSLQSSKRQSSMALRSGGTTGPAYSAQDLPPFAPLLTTLHGYVSAARARRPWATTLPWHSEVLNELSTAFLDDSADNGGQLMAVEIFGVVVKTWAPARHEEELDRWLWICKALMIDSKPLSARAMQILADLLDSNCGLPRKTSKPCAPLALESLASALLDVAFATRADAGRSNHIWRYFESLREGTLMPLSRREVCETFHHEIADGDAKAFVEREVLWIAVLRKISIAQEDFAAWIVGPKLEGLKRFEPPPILHATPPLIIKIRRAAVPHHLAALKRLQTLQTTLPFLLLLQRMTTLVIPEVIYLSDDQEAYPSEELAVLCAQTLLAWQAETRRPVTPENLDPFSIPEEEDGTAILETVSNLLQQSPWEKAFLEALRQMCVSKSLKLLFGLFRTMLEAGSSDLATLSQMGVEHLWKRLAQSSTTELEGAADFLTFVQFNFPQVLYKPLFSCAAASQEELVRKHLVVIRALSSVMGSAVFWTQAPPEMLALVCMGDVSKEQKPTTDGALPFARDKLGRSAVLLDLVVALQAATNDGQTPREEGSQLYAFARTLEDRLVLLWQAQERTSSLPFMRRCLLCQLILLTRKITLSQKSPSWQKSAADWICDAAESVPTNFNSKKQPKLFQECRDMLLSLQEKVAPQSRSLVLSKSSSSPVVAPTESEVVLQTSVLAAAQRLFAASYPSADAPDVARVSSASWNAYDARATAREATLQVFLILIGLEKAPEQVLDLIRRDLSKTNSRPEAQAKLQTMFGLRHQIIASVWQSSRRNRVNLRFPHVDISFVPTELGSAAWVAPVSQQDTDLLRFGRALPVDVRQRLLALGWSDEATVVTSSDWESVPLTQMPLQHLESSLGEATSVASPLHALLCRHSGAEAQVNNQAKRRSCFPPVVTQLVLEHSVSAFHQKDLVTRYEWLLTISTMVRDDPAGLVRELGASLGGENELKTLRIIKDVVFAEVAVPPALAFSAFNSILGYIKTQVRSSGQSQLWRYHSHLSVLSTIAPHVCNFSFREIKKNKVENLILPWEPLDLDDLNIDRVEKGLKVRSAQLRVLESLLQSNPREAYAVKANTVHALPIAMIVGYDANSSLGPTVMTLARNWLILVHRLLSSLNRNYNDQLELEKYLRSVCEILERLGVGDILVTAHCMRILLLSATRFRRLFSSSHLFAAILVSCFNVHDAAFSCSKTRDCIEYAARGFLSVHMDAFAYQLCASVVPRILRDSEPEQKARRLYSLLLSLTRRNGVNSGVASGIKGLNDAQEREALIAMVNDKPEVEIGDMRSAAEQRHARKLEMLATQKYDASTFALEDIVRLFLTVIAAEPNSKRAESFLAVFVMLSTSIAGTGDSCAKLVSDGVSALADIYCRSAPRRPMEISKPTVEWGNAAQPTQSQDGSDIDIEWARLQLLMVKLIERNSGDPRSCRKHLARLAPVLPDLFRLHPEEAAIRVSAAIHRALAVTFKSQTSNAKSLLALLKTVAPIYGEFRLKMPTAAIIIELADAVESSKPGVGDEVATLLLSAYLNPALEAVATTQVADHVKHQEMACSVVRLTLQLSLKTGVDPFGFFEGVRPSCALVSDLLLPLAEALASLRNVHSAIDTEAKRQALDRTWLRSMAIAIRILGKHGTMDLQDQLRTRTSVLFTTLTIQALKLASVCAEEVISTIPGLWSEMARLLRHHARGADTQFVRDEHRILSLSLRSPIPGDWFLWSTARLLVHYKCPLLLDLRSLIQITLTESQDNGPSSRPSSPGLSSGWQESLPRSLGRSRTRQLSTSASPRTALLHQARPSFSDLSLRRESSMTPQFPDSLQRALDRGAIVHLMTAPTKVLSSMAPQTAVQEVAPGSDSRQSVEMRTEEMWSNLEQAVMDVRLSFGYGVHEMGTKAWSRYDAVIMINEETRILRQEFSDVLLADDEGDPTKL